MFFVGLSKILPTPQDSPSLSSPFKKEIAQLLVLFHFCLSVCLDTAHVTMSYAAGQVSLRPQIAKLNAWFSELRPRIVKTYV